MDQVDFFNQQASNTPEEILELYLDVLRGTLREKNISADRLEGAFHTENGIPQKGKFRIKFGNTILFRMKLIVSKREKVQYIEVPELYLELIAKNGFQVNAVKEGETKFLRIPFPEEQSALAYIGLTRELLLEALNRIPPEWNCCSRYMECSNARTCIHPKPDFALECGYRRVLESGRIFYGVNRNID